MNHTPEEVDALVCNPDSQSQATEHFSRDSFNTDKIRKENLGQYEALLSN